MRKCKNRVLAWGIQKGDGCPYPYADDNISHAREMNDWIGRGRRIDGCRVVRVEIRVVKPRRKKVRSR